MNEPSQTTPSDRDIPPSGGRRRGLDRLVLDMFSSVPLGIALLSSLFVYAAIGSAGHYPVMRDGYLTWSDQMIRQLRPFEMTEFEWFHTPLFVVLVALLCTNLTVVTVRKIPLNAVRLGVWMIHTGIIIMSLGSVWYFATKFEGDAPIVKRTVEVVVADERAALPAVVGSSTTLTVDETAAAGDAGGAPVPGVWRFEITDINPTYQMLGAGREGIEDFAVTVEVARPDGERFYRQLLAGHPDIVEDAVMGAPGGHGGGMGGPPMRRVKNVEGMGGRLLFDESLTMRLGYTPQDSFWVKDSLALGVRPAGIPGAAWDLRVLEGMPRYNPYIVSLDDIWPPVGIQRLANDALDVGAPPASDGGVATADVSMRVTGYLRYAVLQERFLPGSVKDPTNTVADLLVGLPDGEIRREQARAGSAVFNGVVGFYWVDSLEELEVTMARTSAGVVRVAVGDDVDVRMIGPNTDDGEDGTFTPIGESGFAYRVRQVVERLPIPGFETPVSVAEIEITTPEGEGVLRRWVFEDPALTRDLPEGAAPGLLGGRAMPLTLDERIDASFAPRTEPFVVIAGPDDIGVRIVRRGDAVSGPGSSGQPMVRPVGLGQVVELADGVGLSVERVMSNAISVMKPAMVPRERRSADADRSMLFALAQVEVSVGGATVGTRWVPYHQYSFDDERLYTGRLGVFRPAVFDLPGGRSVEVIFTRERRDLPHEIALEDFELRAHVGGFTGESLSIRDWVSTLRFRPDAGSDWGETAEVRVNKPVEHDGIWYFQSFWDAPIEPGETSAGSPGKTFTGLGVGNREGIYTILFGSTLSVVGMMYAFYVKPIIKRRRRERALAGAGGGEGAGGAAERGLS